MTLQGILPAVVTPVDSDQNFNPAAFNKLLHRLYAANVDGVYVCGQTGEGMQLSEDTRRRVAEAAIEATPAAKQAIIHVGAFSTREACSLARHASQSGAAAVSALPPFGAFSFTEIRDYYRAIAESSSAPLLVYYFTPLSGAIAHLDQLLEICALPNVAGLKFTDSDFYKLAELVRSGATVFNGSDEMLAAGLLRGAHGGIGSIYNLIPERFVELFSLTRQGRWAEASALQDRINTLIRIILGYPVIAAVKAILGDAGPCLSPRRSLTPAEAAQLKAAIAKTEFASLVSNTGTAE